MTKMETLTLSVIIFIEPNMAGDFRNIRLLLPVDFGRFDSLFNDFCLVPNN